MNNIPFYAWPCPFVPCSVQSNRIRVSVPFHFGKLQPIFDTFYFRTTNFPLIAIPILSDCIMLPMLCNDSLTENSLMIHEIKKTLN